MMKKVYLLLADGFEEVEAFAPVDLLRRSGVEVVTVGIGGREVVGARGVKVIADKQDSEILDSAFDMLILPGGYPGYENLYKSDFVHTMIDTALQNGAFVAAICGAPSILGKRGDLKGKKACCYPGMEQTLCGANVSFDKVCVDGNIITSRSAATAMDFALTLVELLCGEAQRTTLSAQIVWE